MEARDKLSRVGLREEHPQRVPRADAGIRVGPCGPWARLDFVGSVFMGSRRPGPVLMQQGQRFSAHTSCTQHCPRGGSAGGGGGEGAARGTVIPGKAGSQAAPGHPPDSL